ncbi:MAG: esterase [Rhodospirillales bacterium]|nr:esterase [Rhodospirillales bacterium]
MHANQKFQDFKLALRETVSYVGMALKSIRIWQREPPITTANALVKFVETRAKFAAQTSLIGYVKTRAGTRYTSLLEDDLFAESVNIAKWEIYLASLSDLTVHAALRLGRDTGAAAPEMRDAAQYIYESALSGEEIPAQRPNGFAADRTEFIGRIKSLDWNALDEGEGPFQGSLEALLEWAPIAPELKEFDVEIVRNSMRFKWKAVRDQLREILDAEATLDTWRNGEVESSTTAEKIVQLN